MVNEVTSSNSVLHMPTSAVQLSAAHQQVPVKENKEVNAVESSRHEQAVNGKEIPPSQVNNQENPEVNIVEVMHQMQDHVQSIERDLDFRVDEESGRTVITVTDPETDEVVRQIPSEEVLNVMHYLREGGGLLMKEKV